MTVNTAHPEYSASVKRWELIRDILGNCAKKHIRLPSDDDARNAQYREDAILTNFTKLTQTGLTGLVFRKPPTVGLPEGISYLEDDTTGTGVNIWQFAQYIVSETLALGRIGLLVDYSNGARKAFIKPYTAESIINWKTREVNGVVKPWLITLCEWVVKEDPLDVFCQDTVKQYRVLRLNADNIYYQELYNEAEELISQIEITDINGNQFDYIPFVFIGSSNNDWVVDSEPLYDMATVNLGHYQCSADQIESVFICGQPYLHLDIGETDEDTFRLNNPNGVEFGSRKMLITKGGVATLIQASANTMVSGVMQELLAQAAAIGARLISPAGGRETAEAARIRFGSQNSALYTLTSNVSWAIEDAMKIACIFMGADSEIAEFELNDEFYEDTADANLANSMLMWFDRGIIAENDLRDYGRRTGVINPDRTNEELDNEATYLDPLAGAGNAGRNTTPPTTPDTTG